MDFTALVLSLFVLLCQAEGDVREESLSVRTGTDLLLDVGEPVTLKEDDIMLWNFNSTVTVVRLIPPNKTVPLGNYKGRAELFPQNQSLLLKNVQKTDSGEYRAEVSGFPNRVLAQYQVTVVDPVSDVKLEVKQCSSDRSDLTVTCTTLDGLLSSTFICVNTTCSHEGGEPVLNIPPGASVNVTLKNGSVTCYHSNQVSSTRDTKTIEDLCRIKKDKDPVNSASKANSAEIYGPIIAVLILVAVCVAVYYLRSRQQCKTVDVENTEYAEPAALQRDLRPGTGPRNGVQVEAPDTIYSLAGAPTAAPTQTPTETTVKTQPESLYATVEKTAKS